MHIYCLFALPISPIKIGQIDPANKKNRTVSRLTDLAKGAMQQIASPLRIQGDQRTCVVSHQTWTCQRMLNVSVGS